MGVEDHTGHMPKERKACHDPHELDKDDGGEGDVACALSVVGIKVQEEIHDAELMKKVEELIEQTCFAKAIDLRDILALGQVPGNACLIPVGSAPGEAFGNSLRGSLDLIHGVRI